jgi:hypothetical protein
MISKYLCAFALCLSVTIAIAAPKPSAAQSAVDFQSPVTLDDMRQLIMAQFPLGSTRDTLRQAFVAGGKATLREHPSRKGTEKYLYDVNLCRLYVWRWNISADFDSQGRLQQAYINGFAVFPDGVSVPPVVEDAAHKATEKVLELTRPRPEADLGETALAYLLLDLDGDLKTIEDQSLIGAGPGRADPANMGNAVYYESVDPWRSIFDADAADFIAPYAKGCP